MWSTRLLWLLSAMLLGCGGIPRGEEVARVPSPNGRMEAIVTEYNGGATTAFSYNVYVTSAGSPRSEWGRPVAKLYGAIRNENSSGVNPKWSGDGKLTVECLRARGVKLPSPVSRVGDQTVLTNVQTGVLDTDAPPGYMARHRRAVNAGSQAPPVRR
jgi:hypothetical protein